MKRTFSFRHTYTRSAVCVMAAFMVSMLGVPQLASAADTRTPELSIFEAQKKGTKLNEQFSFLAFDESFRNGGTVAVCDVNNDNTDEIIVGAGQGATPAIKVFSANGQMLSTFFALPDTMKMGVNVACGNLDAKGADEIVVAPARGGGPLVQIFDMRGNKQFAGSFFAFDENFRGGAFVAVGNVDGKKGAEIVVGSGPGGGAHVRVFSKEGKYTGTDMFPFASSFRGGVSVAVANVDGGTESEIVTAQHTFGGLVKVYKANTSKTIIGEFHPYGSAFMGGVNVANAGDVDRDNVQEIATAPRQGGGPHVRIMEGHGAVVDPELMVYEESFRGGVALASGNIDTDSKKELITIPQRKLAEGRTDWAQYIEVNLTTQTLTAYKDGVKDLEFLISSGTAKYPTPEGITTVSAKLPVHDYEWSYGPNHPDNYDLKNVRNNLRFRQHFYIHEAYWHNNFGHPMSHGCVNVSPANSGKIYQWANVGTVVWVHR